MEAALNLCWMLVVVLLCGTCVLAHRQKRLRVGLAAALACSLLLAAVLFPAISMTDDLQSLNLQAEVGLRSVVDLMHASLVEPAVLNCGVVLAEMLAAAMCVLVLARLATAQPRTDRLRLGVLRYRPAAVRPPTSADRAYARA